MNISDVTEFASLTSNWRGEQIVFDGKTVFPLPVDAYLADGRLGKSYGVPQLLRWPYRIKQGKFHVTPERGTILEVEGEVLNFKNRQSRLLFQVIQVGTHVYLNVCGDCRRRRHMRRITQA